MRINRFADGNIFKNIIGAAIDKATTTNNIRTNKFSVSMMLTPGINAITTSANKM